MRKILFLLLIIAYVYSNGQDLPLGVTNQQKKDYLYTIRITNFGFNVLNAEEGLCYNELRIVSIDKFGNEENIHHNNNKTEYRQKFLNQNHFRKSEILSLHCQAVSRDKRWSYVRWKCDQNAIIDKRPEIIEKCKVYPFHDIGRHGKGEVNNELYFSYQLLPLHTFSSEKLRDTISNTYLPIGTKVKLFAKEGFP
ncbi:hypothetical protein ACI76O_11930, partial [Capnocytophaga cynodegmi]|uniref:hypothetical protein n=1 Tax=Capnocytophaga cynodegmi TaxID=28189 RepID=UPI003859BD92